MKVAASPRIYMGAMPESGGGSDTGETHFQHTGSQPRLATLDSEVVN